MKPNKSLILLLLSFVFPFCAYSQAKDTITRADEFHLSYRFSEAIELYKSVINSSSDSVMKLKLEEKILQCENGISLLQYASSPVTVHFQQFPIKDFYLQFSDLRDSSWMPIPNPFVKKHPHKYYNAIYFPKEAEKVFFSAPDNSGSWNIYQSSLINGTLWEEPQLLNEFITSTGDELFPILSSNGKELYFTSNGHFGMGGFDLYVSRWDETVEDWGMPENLGFPYSSTSDDLLFLNSSDGQYSIVASTRDSAPDSLTIYVLEYISTPIKKAVSVVDARNMAKLLPLPKPIQEIKKPEEIGGKEDNMSQYSSLVSQMRTLQNSLKKLLATLEENRTLYEKLENEDDKEFLREIIAEAEDGIRKERKLLDEASAKVQAAEMDFLAKGIIPQIEEFELKSNIVSEEEIPSYTFTKLEAGEIRDIEIEKPVPKFDYSFKILPEAIFAEDNTLPNTLVYQIQLSVSSEKASLKSLKGLSPIFEKKQSSGKYVYTVGLFYTHSEALSCLNQVRKTGFSKAFIVAFNKGKSLSVRDAKILEKTINVNNPSYQVVLTEYPQGIPSPILAAIRESCDKDIAKSVKDGKVIYIIGPFSEKANADYVVKILTGLGVTGVSVIAP